MELYTTCDGCENQLTINIKNFKDYWDGKFYCSHCKEKDMTLITMCAGCDKQITVKVDTMDGYRKGKYFCSECETVPNRDNLGNMNTDLALYNKPSAYSDTTSNINLDILTSDTTLYNRYISTEEQKYNKLKHLVEELQE